MKRTTLKQNGTGDFYISIGTLPKIVATLLAILALVWGIGVTVGDRDHQLQDLGRRIDELSLRVTAFEEQRAKDSRKLDALRSWWLVFDRYMQRTEPEWRKVRPDSLDPSGNDLDPDSKLPPGVAAQYDAWLQDKWKEAQGQ